ncbi:MAG: type II secretion system protein GspG [Candidatus Omnitrophica bacterium]|nr:type II secretion system protein GspG [Candidatus Omnitrophota bacterium]
MVRAVNLSPEAKNKRAFSDLRNIKLAVEAYVADYGILPTTSNNTSDLENALVNAKTRLIDYIPNDPWDTSNKYRWQRTASPDNYYVIYSVGSDGSSSINVTSTNGGTVNNGGTDDIWVSNCRNNNSQLP